MARTGLRISSLSEDSEPVPVFLVTLTTIPVEGTGHHDRTDRGGDPRTALRSGRAGPEPARPVPDARVQPRLAARPGIAPPVRPLAPQAGASHAGARGR